jgi:hypothetical protein
MWERTPPGGLRHGEQSAPAGRRGPQELLICKPEPRSTALAGRRELQELLIGTYVPGSNCLAVSVRMHIKRLRSREHFAPRHVCLTEVYVPTLDVS